MHRMMVFIDGTWLWHNLISQNSEHDLRFDLGRLPTVLAENVGKRLQSPQKFEVTGCVLCAAFLGFA
jgi:hypothetical protein